MTQGEAVGVQSTEAFSFAATNLTLLKQLRRLGYSAEDRAGVQRAYALAMRLFTGQFRPSGNTFLAHLVRTASILADLGEPTAVVIAGLLHAAYSHGEFGDGLRSPSAVKRAAMRAVVGAQAESLIRAYDALRRVDVRADLPGAIERLDLEERTAARMRLVNAFEEYVDLAAAEWMPLPEETSQRYLGRCVAAARQLGEERLAVALEGVRAEIAGRGARAEAFAGGGFVNADGALWRDGRGSAFLLPPLSHRPRVAVTVRRRLRRVSWLRALYRSYLGPPGRPA